MFSSPTQSDPLTLYCHQGCYKARLMKNFIMQLTKAQQWKTFTVGLVLASIFLKEINTNALILKITSIHGLKLSLHHFPVSKVGLFVKHYFMID